MKTLRDTGLLFNRYGLQMLRNPEIGRASYRERV